MPTDSIARHPATDPLIDALVADLRPVTPRRWPRDAAILLAVVGTEILAFVAMGAARPDMPHAMAAPSFWWKAITLVLIAGLAVTTVLLSLDPASPARRLRRLWTVIALVVPLALVAGWLLDAGSGLDRSLAGRLEWREGLTCLLGTALLSLPPAIALALLIRRGAPAQPGRTAAAAGLAAATIAALVFTLHCRHDDPLYIVVWYGGAVLGVTLLTRLVLPRLTRW